MMKRKITETVKAIRFNKLYLNKNAVSTICTILKEKLQIKNAASVYQSVNLFNFSSLESTILSYIQRCFTILSDNEKLLELEFSLVFKILSSSELLITSEIEVFKYADRWLNHNIEERSKYAEDLLFKVRLPLLSTETIKQLLNDSTYFKTDDGCVKILLKMLSCREKNSYESLGICHASRYCNQKYFKLLVLGGYNSKASMTCRKVSCVDVDKLGDVEAYPPLQTGRNFLEVVYLKGDVYVFGGWSNNGIWITSVDKYSLNFKTWSHVAEMNDHHKDFCVCAFMDKIFVFGGYTKQDRFNCCLEFDTTDYSWKRVAAMNYPRSSAACAVFEDRIVISGGWINSFYVTKSVESYDVLPNRLSIMPSMNNGKYDHSLVVVKNKLFVVSNRIRFKHNLEVFDNIYKKFITIKSPELNWFSVIKAFSIKNKIFAFKDESSKIICYDTSKNEWSEESCEVTKNLRYFSSVKVPCL